MRIFLLACIAFTTCLSACGTARIDEPLVAGEEVVIEGRVLKIDATLRQYGGDGLIIVQTEVNGDITLRIPAGERPCAARGLDLLNTLRRGDRVRAEGTALNAGTAIVCEADTDLIEKIELGSSGPEFPVAAKYFPDGFPVRRHPETLKYGVQRARF